MKPNIQQFRNKIFTHKLTTLKIVFNEKGYASIYEGDKKVFYLGYVGSPVWELLEESIKIINNSLTIEGMEITSPQLANTYEQSLDLCPKGFKIPNIEELEFISEKSNILFDYLPNEYISYYSSEKDGQNIIRLTRYNKKRLKKESIKDEFNSQGAVVYIKNKEIKEC